MMDGIQKTERKAIAYAAAMQKLHGVKWLVFRLPQGSRAKQFGNFACCRADERADYEADGAVFLAAQEEPTT